MPRPVAAVEAQRVTARAWPITFPSWKGRVRKKKGCRILVWVPSFESYPGSHLQYRAPICGVGLSSREAEYFVDQLSIKIHPVNRARRLRMGEFFPASGTDISQDPDRSSWLRDSRGSTERRRFQRAE